MDPFTDNTIAEMSLLQVLPQMESLDKSEEEWIRTNKQIGDSAELAEFIRLELKCHQEEIVELKKENSRLKELLINLTEENLRLKRKSPPETAVQAHGKKIKLQSSTPKKGATSKKKKADQKPNAAVQEYEVSRIVEMRTSENGHRIFRVRWKGYPPEEDTWEREENLTNCSAILGKFLQKIEQSIKNNKRKKAKSVSFDLSHFERSAPLSKSFT